MSDGRKYYCFCDSNCKFETMTKEQILAAIAQAVEGGSVGNCDTGFITKVKEKNSGSYVSFWVGTQAQYNAITSKDVNCVYIITDDTSAADLMQNVQQIAARCTDTAAAASAAAQQAYDANAAAQAAKNAAEWGSIVSVTSEGVDETVKKYGNGLAEGWYKVRAQGVTFANSVGGLYTTARLRLPYPAFLTESMYYDAPLVCELSVVGTSDADQPVTLLSSGFRNATDTQYFYLASTKQTKVDVDLFAHFVWWWKEDPTEREA